MYQNIYYDRFKNAMHLWDDEFGYHKFEFRKYAYLKDASGEMKTLKGDRVKKVYEWTSTAEELGQVFEFDVRPEVRILIDTYMESDEVSTGHCIFYFDIEVAKGEEGYSSVEDASNPITSISFYDSISQQYSCYILDPKHRINPSDFTDINIVRFNDERSLLFRFLNYIDNLPITISTGWNIDGFDYPYLYNRIEQVLGQWNGKRLSKIRKVDYYTTRYGNEVFKVAGISILDYLPLYKKFTYHELSSYSLDNVSQVELGRGKIEYDKDLDHLLATDPVKFIEYNIEDVRLVVDLDRKLDFIAIAQGICHKGHVPYEDIFYSSRYMDGACLTEVKRRGLVATRSSKRGGSMAKGAFVKVPKPGRYQWVYDLDLTSLYPSNIITLNISPETKWGKVHNWDEDAYVRDEDRVYNVEVYSEDDTLSISGKRLNTILMDNNLSIASNGAMYLLGKSGLIPDILSMWFDERKEFRGLADEYFEAGDMAKFQYYNRKQKIQKILLNSLYGVLLLPSFRFYDKDNGEATTLTGQSVIHYTMKIANYIYNKALDTEGVDYCLYTDTDSVFYQALPLIEKLHPGYKEEQIPEYSVAIATQIQDVINQSYDLYGYAYHNVTNHRWNIKQELIGRRAFWGSAKKRYAMWIVRDGNNPVEKADVKGFDSVRSSFPKVFRKLLGDVIIDILHDMGPVELNKKIIEFKDQLSSYEIYDIMNPTGVKNIEKYDIETGYIKGTPIHIKSVINYNRMLKDLGIKDVPQIYSGDKILWCYLTDNPYGFDTIALRGYDDPEPIIDFVRTYINRDKCFDRAMGKKLQGIWDDLGWGKVIMNKNVSRIFDFGK